MNGEYSRLFLSIAPIWFIAALTPGPNFLITTQTSMERSRRHAFLVVLGIASGTLVWSLAAFFGVSYLFQIAPWLYKGLKLAGAAYLIYLGVAAILKSRTLELHSETVQGELSAKRSFAIGFVTNITNPKTAMFISSLYATTIPQETPIAIGLMCSLQIIFISLLWYSLVATVFSTEYFSTRYLHHQRPLKVVSGVLYIGLGLRLGLRRQ